MSAPPPQPPPPGPAWQPPGPAQPGPVPGHGQVPPPPGPPAPRAPQDVNPFRAAFDVTFRTYATPGLVQILYVLGIVVGVLAWIVAIFAAFEAGQPTYVFGAEERSGTPAYGIVTLLFGWIPVLCWILLLRMLLELVLSNVRTAIELQDIRRRLETRG